MYCSTCGIELSESFRYCPQCGATTRNYSFRPADASLRAGLTRPRDDRKIAGVCSGIARYFEVDPTLVRIIMVVLAIWPPAIGLIVYLIAWIVMPQEPLLLPPAPQATQKTTTQASNVPTA